MRRARQILRQLEEEPSDSEESENEGDDPARQILSSNSSSTDSTKSSETDDSVGESDTPPALQLPAGKVQSRDGLVWDNRPCIPIVGRSRAADIFNPDQPTAVGRKGIAILAETKLE